MAKTILTSEIQHAAQVIRNGGLVAFPTETVYGLGANALDEDAVSRIFQAKGRPATSPLIVHVADVEMARSLVTSWPPEAERLTSQYWPGPLTLVLPKAAHVPDRVTAGLPTVGIRMPNHPVALELIRAAGVPIAAPSANRFTELSPTTVEHLPQDLADFVLDGGPSQVGIESTVVSLVGDQPVLLRPGVIFLEGISSVDEVTGAHPSPGMHHRHYQPRTPLILGDAPDNGNGYRLVLSSDPVAAAASLYAKLHELDLRKYDWIAVDLPPDTPAWAGVRDRLKRAGQSKF